MKKILPTILLNLFFILPVLSQELPKEKIQDSITKYSYLTEEASDNYDYKESIEAANIALSYAMQIDDFYNISVLFNDLGLAYESISELEKSKKNYLQALRYAEKIKNDTLQCWVYNNMGNMYSEGFKKIDSALLYYKKSLEYAQKTKDTFEILTPILNIGWTYIDIKEFDLALPYLNESQKMIYTRHGDDPGKAQINYLLGSYYMNKNDLEKADDYFKTSLRFAHDAEMLGELTEIYEKYSILAKKQGNNELALNRLQKHLEYKDSLYNKDKVRETQAAVAKFEVDDYKKDLERAKAAQKTQETIIKKSQQISYILMIAGFILILLLINMFKNYKFRNKALSKLRLKNAELREAKEEAEQQANLKSQFFSTVSHELRTPLYGVVGLTALLSEDFPNLKDNENFKSLKFSSKYLLSLINNVLQINKIESKGVTLGRTPFKIRDLINEVVNSFSFAINQNKNTVHQEIDPKIPAVLMGDSVRLSQILMNLIGNAIKFTETGNIWIRLELVHQKEKMHTIKFTIEDDGIGIPKDKQVSVFEKFVQLRPIEKNYQGTGLGLSIVKQLLVLFDSHIRLKSEENNGTEFTFVIAFEESCESSLKSANPPIESIDGIEKSILIVDDNKINRVITKRILQTKGYLCDVAEGGLEAIELLQEKRYDLILMDINMPNIDGIETTKRIRKTDQKTPIIALTAVEEDQIKDRIHDAGMNDFIIKPYDLAEFHQIVLKNLYKGII
ncbi:response regulator [Kordia algicida OT-1]|uniref:histidine kinase n=1 Tax=Kordia algicida OT-1 TaxID=391587 RepID=A9E7R1_9FLAO|nr:response regulator [Kordia algicida]EDP94923.1 Signal transduction histidine kinase-like protein [Kordia algicida OT-1]